MVAQPKRVCIVGAGNASHVYIGLFGAHKAGDLPSPQVTVLAPYSNKAELLKPAVEHGITVTDPDGSVRTGRPVVVTRDPAVALAGVSLVLIPLPSFTTFSMFKLIAPHLEHGAVVGVIPAQAGQQWIAPRLLDLTPEGRNIKFFGVDKLQFMCRMTEPGRAIKVFGYKNHVNIACAPNNPILTANLIGLFRRFVPHVVHAPVDNFLVMTVQPGNSCIHPARMYGLSRQRRDPTRERMPLMYEEVDKFSTDLMEKVSDEILSVARAIEERARDMEVRLDMTGVVSIYEIIRTSYTSVDQTSILSSFQTCIQSKGLKAPFVEKICDDGTIMQELDWSSRFFSEDIPALVMMHGIAELVDVKMTTADMLIRWGQKVSSQKVSFLLEDGSINEKVSKDQSFAPQLWGIRTFEDLVSAHFYTGHFK